MPPPPRAKLTLLSKCELADFIGARPTEVFAAIARLKIQPDLHLGGIDRFNADAVASRITAALDYPARHKRQRRKR